MSNPREQLPATLPVDAILDEMAAAAAETGVAGTPVEVEDFHPLAESLEWRLSARYWETRGVRPFREEAVPYAVNGSGWAPEAAAELLFANATEQASQAPGEPLHVLELGAGSGLFARQLLDAFQRICAERGSALYRGLTYHVTDNSPATLEQWRELGIFDDHADRVELARCDALSPELSLGTGGGVRPRAIFINYALDSLPTAIVRRGRVGPEQLHVRTFWRPQSNEGERLELFRLAQGGPEQLEQILPWAHRLEIEVEFRSDGAAELPFVDELLDFSSQADGPERALLNHGALRCLTACLAQLGPEGFVLVNDYGPVRLEDVERMSFVQRFAGSAAGGIHFPFLEKFLTARGHAVVSVAGDEERSIHTRLLGDGDLKQTRAAFERLFGDALYLRADRVSREALEHVAAGRLQDALETLRGALRSCPRDWQLLGQAAELCNQRLLRHQQALELAGAALAINPWTSAYLWNTHGNCLFGLGRHADAHTSYLRGRAIHAEDPQTELNLAFTHAVFGEYGEALTAVARGLACDRTQYFRSALLEKQQQLLTALASRWGEDEARKRRRDDAFMIREE